MDVIVGVQRMGKLERWVSYFSRGGVMSLARFIGLSNIFSAVSEVDVSTHRLSLIVLGRVFSVGVLFLDAGGAGEGEKLSRNCRERKWRGRCNV